MTPPDSGEREVRSPEYDRLLRLAVEQKEAEDRKLNAMTQAQRDKYIREWAASIAPGLCADATAHDREMSAPWLALPLSLAQRILAEMVAAEGIEERHGYQSHARFMHDLASELRAAVERKP